MKVYASAIGQYDNVGDTVLRRGFLTTVRRSGPLHLYVGGQTDDQLGALGLRGDEVLYRRSSDWRAELGRTFGRRPALYAFDSGETELKRSFALRYLRLAPLLLLNRLRGGAAAHIGVGVRESTGWRIPIALVLRLCHVVTWRDETSRRVMRVGSVTPDWAFALGSPEPVLRDPDRPVLAVAVRASLEHAPRTEPDDAWADRIALIAQELGLTPVFVAQIGRDGPLAQRLADRVGAEALVWSSADHAEFEEDLRALYRRSAIVLSDRLHGLVIGATEGAVPVPLGTSRTDKTVRTLDAVGIADTAIEPALDGDATAALRSAWDRHDEVVTRVLAARARLVQLGDRLATLGRG